MSPLLAVGADLARFSAGGTQVRQPRSGLRWVSTGLLLTWFCAVLSGLAGCATSGLAEVNRAMQEPITESDEPLTRKRARLRLELASNYFETGQTNVALDEIKQSLAADPLYAPAFVLRGLVHMRLGNSRLAEESFQRALKLSPHDPDAMHNYGWFLCQEDRQAQALELFKQAMAIPGYTGQAKTGMALGICQVRLGQYAEAEASFARSHQLDTANPITAYNLAALLYRRGAYTPAQASIRLLNNSDLANAETLWLGIRVERRLSNSTAVEQLAQQLGRRYPQSPEWVLFQRGAFDE